jgi:hypothetical protein
MSTNLRTWSLAVLVLAAVLGIGAFPWAAANPCADASCADTRDVLEGLLQAFIGALLIAALALLLTARCIDQGRLDLTNRVLLHLGLVGVAGATIVGAFAAWIHWANDGGHEWQVVSFTTLALGTAGAGITCLVAAFYRYPRTVPGV